MEAFQAVSDLRAVYDAIEGFPTIRAAAASLAHIINEGTATVSEVQDVVKGAMEMKAAHRLGSHVHDSAQSPINRKRSRTDDGEADDVVKRLRMPVAHTVPRRHGMVDLAWTPIVTC